MAEWLQIDSNLPTKPEVRRICRKTGADAAVVIGRLVIFWSHVDQHGDLLDEDERPDDRPDLDGIIPDYELDDLLDLCGGDDEFWEVVASTGWLCFDSRGLLLPGFEKRFHISAKRRAEAALRKQRQRARDQGVIGTEPKKSKPTRQASREAVTAVTDEPEAKPATTKSASNGRKSYPWQFVTDAKLKKAVTDRKPAIIETLYRESVTAGWLDDTPHARHRFYSAVVYGVRDEKVKSCKALLTYKVKESDWKTGTNAADDEAKRLIQVEDGTDRPRVSNLEPAKPNFDNARQSAIAELAGAR